MCEEFEKMQDLGLLQGMWVQHLTYVLPIETKL